MMKSADELEQDVFKQTALMKLNPLILHVCGIGILSELIILFHSWEQPSPWPAPSMTDVYILIVLSTVLISTYTYCKIREKRRKVFMDEVFEKLKRGYYD